MGKLFAVLSVESFLLYVTNIRRNRATNIIEALHGKPRRIFDS
jgi:hypothetical protein